jgi:hypothetical protein
MHFILPPGTQQWKEYTSREGKYTVLLPGEPITDVIAEGVYSPSNLTYVTNLKTPVANYHIGYFDTSELVTETEKIKEILKNTRDQMIKRNLLSLQDESEKDWQIYPGRSLIMKSIGGKVILARIYLIRQRTYFLTAESYAESYIDQHESIDADNSSILSSQRRRPMTR